MPSKKIDKKLKTKPKAAKLSPTAKLNEKIDILKAESEIQGDRYLRLKAEFDNYRRRKENEFTSLLKYDGESVIKQFLSVLDDLEDILLTADVGVRLVTEFVDELRDHIAAKQLKLRKWSIIK